MMNKSNEQKKEYPAIVQEIHTEFHEAADNLMIEAEKILSEAGNLDTGKVDRLKSLGFGKADEVEELQPQIIGSCKEEDVP